MATIECVRCGVSRDMPLTKAGEPRTPKGWKVLHERPHCAACKRQAYMLRAVTLPVSGPEGAPWATFREALREAWGEATRCANWVMTELYARDVRREADDRTLRKMPRMYLYPEARERFPALSPQTVANLVQDVQAAYRAHRYELLWTGARTLATYRYPAPYPIPSQAWRLDEQQGRWYVVCRLGDRRWRLKLRGGPQMRYQAERLRQLMAGEAQPGAATLYQVVVQRGGHRTGAGDGDRDRDTRVMVKLAAWLPKAEQAARAGVLSVRTGPDALLSIAGHDWKIDAAPLRGALCATARRRQALTVNLSHERRRPRRRREGMADAMSELSRKSRLRIADACRTYAAHVAAYANRQRAAQIDYDDRDRSALPSFPWEQLRQAIANKLEESGMRLVHVNGREGIEESRNEESKIDESKIEE